MFSFNLIAEQLIFRKHEHHMMVNLNFEDDRNISSICISVGIYPYTIIITERKLTAVARK